MLADSLGAKPPRKLPKWLARLFAGEHMVVMLTEIRGATNEKAKRELGWTPGAPDMARGLQGARCRSFSGLSTIRTVRTRPWSISSDSTHTTWPPSRTT